MNEEVWGVLLALVGLIAVILLPAPWYFFISMSIIVAGTGIYLWIVDPDKTKINQGKDNDGTE